MKIARMHREAGPRVVPPRADTESRRTVALARPCIGSEEKRAVMEVLDSGAIAQGRKVLAFEEAFAAYCGTKHAVALANGTVALHAMLSAAGIGDGDEVVTTPLSFAATANAVLMAGAEPVFADIDPLTMNLDPENAGAALTPRTRALLAVHLYGLPCDMDSFQSLAERGNLLVLEDSCQAHGATYRGRRAGSLGNAACFSFYATKNMTCGEGGMITTFDDGIAERARRLRFHGQDNKGKYVYRELGFNYRMTDIAAALGLCQLEKLPSMNDLRRANASLYRRLLAGIPGFVLPPVAQGAEHVYHQFTVRVVRKDFGLDRDELARALSRFGIETGIHYPLPLHVYPQFTALGYRWGDFPNAERASGEVLSLPVGPHLCGDDIAYVAACIREVAERAVP